MIVRVEVMLPLMSAAKTVPETANSRASNEPSVATRLGNIGVDIYISLRMMSIGFFHSPCGERRKVLLICEIVGSSLADPELQS
jgi:hypothetical protein